MNPSLQVKSEREGIPQPMVGILLRVGFGVWLICPCVRKV